MPRAKYKKDKNGLYYTYEKTGLYKSDGSVEYKKLRCKTIAGLDAKVEAFKQSKMFNLRTDRVTVDAWKEQWFAAYKSATKPSTQNFYLTIYEKHISPAIGALLVSQVTEAQCQLILTGLAETHSEKTVKSVRSTLYSIFEKARSNRLIAFNPCEHLTAAGRKPKQRRALTLFERAAYLKACETHDFGTFAAFLYFFGLRRGEALALTGADVFADHIRVNKQFSYPENNRPHLDAPKSAAGVREIPIPTKARKYIDFKNLPQGCIFSNEDGEPYSYSEIVDRWNSFIRSALGNETEVTMHYLRHNYCTMLFEQNVDIQTVKTLAGHEDINTTLKIYTHYTETLEKQSQQKILNVG